MQPPSLLLLLRFHAAVAAVNIELLELLLENGGHSIIQEPSPTSGRGAVVGKANPHRGWPILSPG